MSSLTSEGEFYEQNHTATGNHIHHAATQFLQAVKTKIPITSNRYGSGTKEGTILLPKTTDLPRLVLKFLGPTQ